MSEPGESFTCARCGGTFEKERSDDEALADAESLWTPETMAAPQADICDPCFGEFLEWAKVNIPEALLLGRDLLSDRYDDLRVVAVVSLVLQRPDVDLAVLGLPRRC